MIIKIFIILTFTHQEMDTALIEEQEVGISFLNKLSVFRHSLITLHAMHGVLFD